MADGVVKRPEQRRSPRYRCGVVVDLTEGRSRRRLVSLDVSRHGLFISTESPPAERFLVRLTAYLPDGPMAGTAFVSRRVTTRSGGVLGAGLQFFALSTQAKERWDHFVHQLAGGGAVLLPARNLGPPDRATFIIKLKDTTRLFEFYEKNFTAGGLYLATPVLKETGAEVALVIVHPDSEQEFLLVGRVERVCQVRPKGMEVRLEPMSTDERARFRRFVTTGQGPEHRPSLAGRQAEGDTLVEGPNQPGGTTSDIEVEPPIDVFDPDSVGVRAQHGRETDLRMTGGARGDVESTLIERERGSEVDRPAEIESSASGAPTVAEGTGSTLGPALETPPLSPNAAPRQGEAPSAERIDSVGVAADDAAPRAAGIPTTDLAPLGASDEGVNGGLVPAVDITIGSPPPKEDSGDISIDIVEDEAALEHSEKFGWDDVTARAFVIDFELSEYDGREPSTNAGGPPTILRPEDADLDSTRLRARVLCGACHADLGRFSLGPPHPPMGLFATAVPYFCPREQIVVSVLRLNRPERRDRVMAELDPPTLQRLVTLRFAFELVSLGGAPRCPSCGGIVRRASLAKAVETAKRRLMAEGQASLERVACPKCGRSKILLDRSHR